MTHVPAPMVHAPEQAVSVGRTTAPEESRADRDAGAATDRMGLGYARGTAASDPLGGTAAPPAALQATAGGGRPLADPVRSGMEQGFGRSFGQVRIHDGPAAAKGAQAVGADAFTLGSDIVFAKGAYQPDSHPGAALLSHELAHTLSPEATPTLRRGVGFFEDVARFFGHGSFSEAELKDYLNKLSGKNPTGKPGEDSGAIEGDFDGDNKARAVVEADMHNDQPVRVRSLLIKEMLDGWVSEADEEAVIVILEEAAEDNMGDFFEIVESVGSDKLQSDLTGKEYDTFMELLGELRDTEPVPAVPLDWKVNYTISGAPNAMPGKQGLLLNSLGFQTMDGKSTPLASDSSVTTDGQEIGSNIPHPRNEGGELSIDAAPGRIEGDKVIPDATGMQQAKTTYPVISHSYDTAEVLVDLFYGERVGKVDIESTANSEGTVGGTHTTHTEGKSTVHTTGDNTTDSATVGVKQGATKGRAVTVKKGAAVRQGKEDKQVDLKTKKDETSDVDLNKKIDTKDTVDLTANTTGTNTTTGDITVDLNDITFDADVSTAIKGTVDVSKGETSWTRKLVDLTEPIRRKIVDKVLKRYLGPGSGPATEGVEWIIDQLVGNPPDWTVTVDLTNKGTVKGSVSGNVTAKWKEVQKINTKTKTDGTIKREGTEQEQGKIRTQGSGSVQGNEKTDKVEIEQSAGVDQTASEGASLEVNREKLRANTKIDETAMGDFQSDSTTILDEKHKFETKTKGTETPNYVAFFERADLRVRLTGEKGRYNQTSEPGQRGGGGTDRPTQQKGGQP